MTHPTQMIQTRDQLASRNSVSFRMVATKRPCSTRKSQKVCTSHKHGYIMDIWYIIYIDILYILIYHIHMYGIHTCLYWIDAQPSFDAYNWQSRYVCHLPRWPSWFGMGMNPRHVLQQMCQWVCSGICFLQRISTMNHHHHPSGKIVFNLKPSHVTPLSFSPIILGHYNL